MAQRLDFKSFDTRRNLPDRVGQKRGESNFLAAFARTMVNNESAPCVYGRHFSMPGCGVADLVLCRFESSGVSLFAFEAKLTNWRRAFQQAYRYRYYADKAFVVLPQGQEARAAKNQDRFREMGIGLCVYDRHRGSITILCEPQPGSALNPQKRAQALDRIRARVRNLRQASEDIKPFLQSRQVVGV